MSLRGPSRPTLPSTEEQGEVGGDRDLYPEDSTKEMPDRQSHRAGQEEMSERLHMIATLTPRR
ncbi:hypothetical protein F511_47633 [Dorcoceras hygrometricum]|uniref:Uncharacterized protein n=1 Tax=Dorcoceras hygrometricum TaxID=472368 RepID=A0A2Z6ZQL4_9LAMI|nr:hypothetical protein F511_47633 [Dorcoceras hygrometricum]